MFNIKIPSKALQFIKFVPKSIMEVAKLEPLLWLKEVKEVKSSRREIHCKNCIEERGLKNMLDDNMCHDGMNSFMTKIKFFRKLQTNDWDMVNHFGWSITSQRQYQPIS